ncbi:S-DNA-T family DNA segregation ATPase FtsK/SpoIIIE [Nocardioides albertanoniae]|uniref:S-DNA-T family DNA segregation ATPase FtsK/SpoIIIE n=1 Tax=Nocardioides albertanoniae TaxID=1175486 RepID=A0A543ABV1_9ACTN|nr:FtsK/SpoIIIE domain-containing protein [Nocardioides albertanoniae]TQL70071.1 S-DNA-T family DNA segregation ATPase FtsK/SpoIIIE [Nocardioides albertanoniae]
MGDWISRLLRGATLKLFKATVLVVWFLFTHPGLFLPTAVLGCATAGVLEAASRMGWLLVAGLALGTLLGLAGLLAAWWRFAPSTFARFAGPTGRSTARIVRNWIGRWFRYGILWGFWMRRCGLTKNDRVSGRVLAPRLVKVRSTPAMDRLLVRLPAGMAPSALEGCGDALANAMRASEARVRKHKPGMCWLELEKRNPLAKTIGAIPVPTGGGALDVARLDGLHIGYTDHLEPWRLKIRGNHLFVAGESGSGKGSVIWSMLRSLAPLITTGLVQVWAIDPKGGMELEFGKDMFKRYERDNYEAMAQLFEDAVGVMDDRTIDLRGVARSFTVSPETPLVILLVDELADVTELNEDRQIQNRIENAMGRLLTKGRAPGFAVVACTQIVTKDVVRWRDLFTIRIALRLKTFGQVDMSLGEGAHDAGAYCEAIPEDLQGIGYVRLEGRSEPVRVRAGYVTDEEIQDMNDAYPAGGRTLVPTGRRDHHDDTTTLEPDTATTSNRIGLAETDLVPAVARTKNTRPGDNRPPRGPSSPNGAPRTRKPRKPRNRRDSLEVVAGEVVGSSDSTDVEVLS